MVNRNDAGQAVFLLPKRSVYSVLGLLALFPTGYFTMVPFLNDVSRATDVAGEIGVSLVTLMTFAWVLSLYVLIVNVFVDLGESRWEDIAFPPVISVLVATILFLLGTLASLAGWSVAYEVVVVGMIIGVLIWGGGIVKWFRS